MIYFTSFIDSFPSLINTAFIMAIITLSKCTIHTHTHSHSVYVNVLGYGLALEVTAVRDIVPEQSD